MLGVPTTFWGKLDKDDASGVVRAWHPLVAHCADVAACTEALLRTTLLRARLAALAGRTTLTDFEIGRLCVIAALHDVGKFNWGFQAKAELAPARTAGHVAEVLTVLGSARRENAALLGALPTDHLERWGEEGAATRLLVAAIGHHGRPVAVGPQSGVAAVDPALWEHRAHGTPFEGIASLTEATRAWFPEAYEAEPPTLPGEPAFHHAFAGLVMLADWLGSDRAPGLFTFAEDLGERMRFAREIAKRAVESIGLDTRAARQALGGERPRFSAVSAFAPRDAQAKTMSLPSGGRGSLTILESETGSGKTEAALGRFVQLLHDGAVDGMMFALPTRTAATQIHGRVLEAMRRAFPEARSRPAVVLAVPGYLRFDDVTGKRLPGFEVLWNDDPAAATRHRGWPAEQPKRYLAGTVVVGTIDQVLLSSLRVSHAHLRATALLRHLLVVDEVHASDAYMNRVLEEVLRFHVAAGGHAFLMSATLGVTTRERLQRAALREDQALAGLSLAAACSAPYPVVHHADRGERPVIVAVEAPGLPKEVQVEVRPIADEPGSVVAIAIQAAREGARVLVLRNTVTDAVATQLALETAAHPEDAPTLFSVHSIRTLHHARFSREDRARLDVEIESRFGKRAPNRQGAIAVATQTVQQSLDLDADLMLTDLAPMDVLLQRLGRVHRHRERDPVRPPGFVAPKLIVLTGADPLDKHFVKGAAARGPHGIGTVYDNVLTLEATRQELLRNRQLRIPDKNRELVERTVHPEALQALAQHLGPTWLEHLSHVDGTTLAQKGIARLNLVDRSASFGEYTFRDEGLTERISARLGESDRRVRFEPPLSVHGPFGGALRELSLPGWLARGLPSDPDLRPSDVAEGSDETGHHVSFTFGTERFVYDRLGLRKTGPAPREEATNGQ